jgi:hypothetical protein
MFAIFIGVAATVIVFAVGIVVILTRSKPRSSASVEADEITASKIELVGHLPAPPDDAGALLPTPTSRGADAGIPEVEIPIWARPPRVLTMPYPEGGAYNPPLPPVKLPPEMIGDPGDASTDANQRIDSSSTSNTIIPLG